MCNCSVIVHRFVFPAKSMPVVLMEHNWNVFQRMGGQHWVLLMPSAQYRNPICLESIINEGTAAAARQRGDTWLVATLWPRGAHGLLTCSLRTGNPPLSFGRYPKSFGAQPESPWSYISGTVWGSDPQISSPFRAVSAVSDPQSSCLGPWGWQATTEMCLTGPHSLH